MKRAVRLGAIVSALVLVAHPAQAQYTILWSIVSPSGFVDAGFDLGEKIAGNITTQHGGQGNWAGGPAHSAQGLEAPGGGVHLATGSTNTVYGDTDGDGVMEFVSDDGISALHVWDGATGLQEAAAIPYPGANVIGCGGIRNIEYIALIDVNPGDGLGRSEIIVHWTCLESGNWGTTCFGLVGPTAAPSINPPQETGNNLLQNAPNPFRGATTMRLQLAEASPVELRIYDAQGRLVRKLSEGTKDPGTHEVRWDGRDQRGNAVSAGVYYYELASARGKEARRAIRLE